MHPSRIEPKTPWNHTKVITTKPFQNLLEKKCKFKEKPKQRKNLPKNCDNFFEKQMLLLMNKNLKVILIIPILNT